MTESELYRFIRLNHIEYRWHENNLFVFVPLTYLSEFAALVSGYTEEDGLDINLRGDYVCISTMVEICEYFDIEPRNIFTENSNR